MKAKHVTILSIVKINIVLFFFLFSLASCNNISNLPNGSLDSLSENQPELITLFQDSTYQLTGIAVSREGRLFTNYPYWTDVYQYAVVETNGLNSSSPYPDLEWNSWEEGKDPLTHFLCVQAVVIDRENTMWVVDAANILRGGVVGNGQKLVKINLNTNQVERVYPMTGTTSSSSYLNDVRVDTERDIAYITNSAEGGIVILDLQSGESRQVLQGSHTVLSEPSYIPTVLGNPLIANGTALSVQSDGIALSADGNSLYFKSLTDDRLFLVSTADLRNAELSLTELESRVKFLGNFTVSDGMEIDEQGNLYLSDFENRRIVQIKPDLTMHEFVADSTSLVWPDSFQISHDGQFLYVSTSFVDQQPEFHNGENVRVEPYSLFKVSIAN